MSMHVSRHAGAREIQPQGAGEVLTNRSAFDQIKSLGRAIHSSRTDEIKEFQHAQLCTIAMFGVGALIIAPPVGALILFGSLATMGVTACLDDCLGRL